MLLNFSRNDQFPLFKTVPQLFVAYTAKSPVLNLLYKAHRALFLAAIPPALSRTTATEHSINMELFTVPAHPLATTPILLPCLFLQISALAPLLFHFLLSWPALLILYNWTQGALLQEAKHLFVSDPSHFSPLLQPKQYPIQIIDFI